MRIIINCSVIRKGGSVQVALSLLEELKNTENTYHVFLSEAVDRQIQHEAFGDNFHFHLFTHSPADLKNRYSVMKQIKKLEHEIGPDLVFTVFGPAYWTPKTTHISGFADAWCYTPDTIAFKKLRLKDRIILRLVIFIKQFYIKKAHYIIVETNIAKKNIIKNLGIQDNRIFVVGNTYHKVFLDCEKKERIEYNEFKLLVLSSFYVHKNLSIINDVIFELKKRTNRKYKFYLTIDNETFKSIFFETDYIENLGHQNISNCPAIYNQIDAIFLPTLLETFSANYPEAMIMQRPILTSDFDFAHDICGDSALYFNPLSAEDIAQKIILLSENKDLYRLLIKKGNDSLKSFETPKSRAEKYLSIFNNCVYLNEINRTI